MTLKKRATTNDTYKHPPLTRAARNWCNMMPLYAVPAQTSS